MGAATEKRQSDRNNPENRPLLIWGVPKSLIRRFKARCVMKGKPMKTVIVELIQKFLENPGILG